MDSFCKMLALQTEVDYLVWLLKEMLETEKGLPAISKMIDESTGFDKEKLRRARRIMKAIKKRKQKYYVLSGAPGGEEKP